MRPQLPRSPAPDWMPRAGRADASLPSSGVITDPLERPVSLQGSTRQRLGPLLVPSLHQPGQHGPRDFVRTPGGEARLSAGAMLIESFPRAARDTRHVRNDASVSARRHEPVAAPERSRSRSAAAQRFSTSRPPSAASQLIPA